MPFVRIEYNDAVVSKDEATQLAEALQQIVAVVTNIDDVNVYAGSAPIKVNALPVEVLIRMSAGLIKDEDALLAGIKTRLAAWKIERNFAHPINVYLIPMHWKVAADI